MNNNNLIQLVKKYSPHTKEIIPENDYATNNPTLMDFHMIITTPEGKSIDTIIAEKIVVIQQNAIDHYHIRDYKRLQNIYDSIIIISQGFEEVTLSDNTGLLGRKKYESQSEIKKAVSERKEILKTLAEKITKKKEKEIIKTLNNDPY